MITMQIHADEYTKTQVVLAQLAADLKKLTGPIAKRKNSAAQEYCKNKIMLINRCNELIGQRPSEYIDGYYKVGMEKIEKKLDYRAIDISYDQDWLQTAHIIKKSGFVPVKNTKQPISSQAKHILARPFPIDSVRLDLHELIKL